MSERECSASKKDIELGPHTEVTVECGLTNREHLHTHLARQYLGDEVTVTYTWPGDFEPAKGGGEGDG